jgi:hypothetical protein
MPQNLFYPTKDKIVVQESHFFPHIKIFLYSYLYWVATKDMLMASLKRNQSITIGTYLTHKCRWKYRFIYIYMWHAYIYIHPCLYHLSSRYILRVCRILPTLVPNSQPSSYMQLHAPTSQMTLFNLGSTKW